MRNYLIYDGKNLADFGVWISGSGTANAPSRSVETVSVPGRNGTLTFDNGKFDNALVRYPAFIRQNFDRNMAELRKFLGMSGTYRRLEDTYNPEEFHMARYVSALETTPSQHHVAGRFTLEFDCMPQRFLKSGEIPMSLTVPTTLHNPGMEALPLITVYGTGAGSVTVGGVTVDIKSLDEYVILDCDTQNAYRGILENKNNTISAPEFPTIPPGESRVGWTGGVERVEIVPRWWVL